MDNRDQPIIYNEYNEPVSPVSSDVVKKDYEGSMEERLRVLGARLDELKAKTDENTAKTIEELKAKQAIARQRLKEIKATSGDAWTEMRQGLDKVWEDLTSAWNELKVASEKAKEKFKH
jgi:capsule polysaccharide export protein KpsE/RkpR